MAEPKIIYIGRFVEFYVLNQKLEMKLVNSFRLKERHTDEPILRISYKLIKNMLVYYKKIVYMKIKLSNSTYAKSMLKYDRTFVSTSIVLAGKWRQSWIV